MTWYLRYAFLFTGIMGPQTVCRVRFVGLGCKCANGKQKKEEYENVSVDGVR